jgi:integrase
LYKNKDGKASRRTRITNQIQNHFIDLKINTHAEGTGFQFVPDPDIPGEFKREHTGVRAVVEVGFHSLRHTFVSMQAEKGTSALLVQKIVGHGNPAMTQHYHHISDEAAKSATLHLNACVKDAEFEEVREVPGWIREMLETASKDNWEDVIQAVLNGEKA